MNADRKSQKKDERAARLQMWLAKRSSRNRTLIDKICRWMIERALKTDPKDDFMRDPLIDNDPGFDPEDLDRYQRGDIS